MAFNKILIGFLLSNCTLFAAIYHDIDTTSSLKCTLSSRNQNRVVIADGRVRKAIFQDERIALQMEEESGQAFIYPLEFIDNPITVAIVTESGLVQDLEIQFVDKSSEVVILKEKKLNRSKTEGQNLCHELTKTIETIIEGTVPRGFVCLEDCGKQFSIKRRVVGESIARFEGEEETIYFYRIINKCRHQICLNEVDLRLDGNTWIYLDRSFLNRKEETFALIAVKR